METRVTIRRTKGLEVLAQRAGVSAETMTDRVLGKLPRLVDMEQVKERGLYGLPLEYVMVDDILLYTVLKSIEDCGFERVTDYEYDLFKGLILEEAQC